MTPRDSADAGEPCSDERGGTVPPDEIVEGRLATQVAKFGTPLAVGMGLQTTFNLVDAYIIARLDHHVATAALGAIGICDLLAALGTIVSYGISVATAAIVSRRHGAGDFEGVKRVAWQSLLIVLALSAVFGFVAVAGAETLMVDVVGAKGRVAELGTSYLRVMVGGSFSIFLLVHLTTLQRALGSSKTPITMLVAANVANLVLAVLLVYGPGRAPAVFGWGPALAETLGLPRLELMGAAWATVGARVFVLLPTTWIIVRRFGLFTGKSRSGPDREAMRKIIGVGWPTSAQLVVRISAMLATHALVARAYTTSADQTATTALGIVFRLETMALFVGLGWGSAAQTFMGTNLGAGQPARAQQSGWYAMAYNAIMMAALAAVYVRYAEPITAFFDSDPRVVSVAVDYLGHVAPSYVVLGVGIVLGSAIQGAGATRHTLVVDALVVLAVQLPLSWLVTHPLHLEPMRLWQVLALIYTMYAAIYAHSYHRGRFLSTRLT